MPENENMTNTERTGGTTASAGEKKTPNLLGFLEVATELATFNIPRDATVPPQVADRFVALQARRQSLIDQAIENPGDSLLGLRTRNIRGLIALGGDKTKVSEQLDSLGTSLDRVTDPNTRAALEHWIADTQEKIKGSSVAEAPVVSGAKPAQASSVETPKATTPVQEDPRAAEIQKLQEQERLLKAEFAKDPGDDDKKMALQAVELRLMRARKPQEEPISQQTAAVPEEEIPEVNASTGQESPEDVYNQKLHNLQEKVGDLSRLSQAFPDNAQMKQELSSKTNELLAWVFRRGEFIPSSASASRAKPATGDRQAEPATGQEQSKKAIEELERINTRGRELQRQFDSLGEQAARIDKQIQDTVTKPGDGDRSNVEELQKRHEELTRQQAETQRNLSDLWNNDLGSAYHALAQARTSGSRTGRPDIMMGGSGGESLPDIETVGPVDLERRFDLILHGLVEKQKDQSFDQNWRLVLPLEMAIQSLSFRAVEGHVVRGVSSSGEKFDLSPQQLAELSDRLNRKLNSFRNMHNFTYIFRRVGGTTPVIEADSLLTPDTLETLLRTPEVAQALRDYEKLGEAVYDLKKRAFKVVTGIPTLETRSRLSERDRTKFNNDEAVRAAKKAEGDLNNEASNLERKGKALMLGPSSGEEFELNGQELKFEQPFWAYRIAGGLFSGLNDSARFDMQINEAGDFFVNRVYNTKSRAKALWEGKWGRFYDPGLYEALDFKVDSFWEKIFEGRKIGFRMKILEERGIERREYDKFQKDSRVKNEIDGETRRRFNQYYEPYKILYTPDDRISLTEARFEDMVLATASPNARAANAVRVEMPASDQPKQITLDIDDYNNVRKLFFDAGFILDNPMVYFNLIRSKVIQSLKPMRGEAGSKWVSELTYQMVEIFKDRKEPFNDDLHPRDSRNLAKEIYGRDHGGLSVATILGITDGLTPPLTPEAAENLKERATGKGRFERGAITWSRDLSRLPLWLVEAFFNQEAGINKK